MTRTIPPIEGDIEGSECWPPPHGDVPNGESSDDYTVPKSTNDTTQHD
jgi:hypothetical protein